MVSVSDHCVPTRLQSDALYSAPEILLGATTYSTAIDMWSVGCIFAELILKEPLFQAHGELELISMIFKLLGPPTKNSWPEYSTLPLAATLTLPSPQPHQFRSKFPYLTAAGLDLLMSLLTYDPERRITAEEALEHPYFTSERPSFMYMILLITRIFQRIALAEASIFVWILPVCCRRRKVCDDSDSHRQSLTFNC